MRQKTVVLGVAVGLALAGCGQRCRTAYTPPPGPARPLLWQVQGPSSSIVVLGTYQAAGEKDVPDRAWTALDGAALLVAEADEVEINDRYQQGESWRKAFILPPGRSLQKMLSEDDFYELQNILETSPGRLNRLKPWVAMFRLMSRSCPQPTPNMSEALLDHARAHGISPEFFETWPEQVEFLDQSVTPEKLARAIHDYSNMRCAIRDSVAAYRAGDYAHLVEPVQPGDPIAARVERWLPKVEQYLQQGTRAFIAVGIANVVGPSGLLARLEARGYRVQPLR